MFAYPLPSIPTHFQPILIENLPNPMSGTRMARGWYADGTRMVCGWYADGTHVHGDGSDGTRIDRDCTQLDADADTNTKKDRTTLTFEDPM